ncbi:glycosyltransferase [Megasphaera paucivorans]|uniref:Glycosyltransferase involved in cell wall bisynthesis n=1 Tax=Megasphaera paucivorans TaxID=349095 RepID=A0A1G9W0P0_9FIRM|nr:glycosyltransferase [Megasphaera paucivorans]SDM78090.1 Glycosyltransferase involved in cell wall bisynthesis [Megasphaera paucivorans]
MTQPMVSVIMGTFNSNFHRLEIAIESILYQTYSNWEFIICDDGSTNGTYEWLCEKYLHDNRFMILQNTTNQHLAATLNKCIFCSHGKYIARMDDDDYSYPDRFFKEISVLEQDANLALVSSSTDIFDGTKIIGINKSLPNPQKKDFLWGSCFVHPVTMFRKSALLAVNNYRTQWITKRPAEDYDLFMRLYSAGYRGINIQESLLRYYVNPQAMKKRKYIFRVEEAFTRFYGFKDMGVLFPIGWIYVFKPLFVGLIPSKMLFLLQKKITFSNNKNVGI